MIGIGMMGHGIASNLLTKGQSLSVLDHVGNQPIDDLKEKGARTYQSAKELANHNDIVILCVTSSPQVEVVLAGEDVVLKGMRPSTIIIDCTTAVPTLTERIRNSARKYL
jgi:3-hydroxyisobutyrate dehydrogenase-like beta-hydroxyacid dehydrogenase